MDGEALISDLLVSFVENMRVNRSLTDVFSTGFSACFGRLSPTTTCPFNWGEPLVLLRSMDPKDLTDAGYEELDTVVDLDSEALAMLDSDGEDGMGRFSWKVGGEGRLEG